MGPMASDPEIGILGCSPGPFIRPDGISQPIQAAWRKGKRDRKGVGITSREKKKADQKGDRDGVDIRNCNSLPLLLASAARIID